MKTIKILSLFFLCLTWELIAQAGIFSSFIFPSITDTVIYMIHHTDRLFIATGYTLKLLISGLALSSLATLAIAALTAVSTKLKASTETVISIVSPIPAIAILPFAILWFGLGENPIIFVTFFGSICPFLINVLNAFNTINRTWLDVGRNYGLKALSLVRHIILPASLPHIISGFRSAWGVAWRSVVASELVFGAVGGKGGLGWLIYANRFQLNAAGMMAALISISLIGIFMENVLLNELENKTVKKWGMKR